MEWQRKLMGVGEGLHRVLDLIYQFRSVTTAWQQDARTGAAAELHAISVFCNSKMGDLYGRAAYGTPGAVAALSALAASSTSFGSQVVCVQDGQAGLSSLLDLHSAGYLEGRIQKQQAVLQQCLTYPKLSEGWHTKLLGNVLAELRGAFALGLVSATTEVLSGQSCISSLSSCAGVMMTSLLCMATQLLPRACPPAAGSHVERMNTEVSAASAQVC